MSRSLEFRVGLVTLAATVFFIWMIVFVSEHNPLEEKYNLELQFTDIGLLQDGDQVRINGIPIGKVESIRIRNDKVMVKISVTSKVKIRKDATIVVGDVGLFGTNYIKISQYRTTKNPEYWQPDDVIIGSEEPGFEELLKEGQDMIAQAKNVLMSINLVMADEDFHRDFKGVFTNLRETTASTKRMFSNLEKRSKGILDDISGLTSSLESNSEKIGDSAVIAVDKLNNLMSDLETLARENKDSLGKTVKSLSDMVERFDNQGKTVDDLKNTLSNLHDISSSLKKLLADIEAGGETAENIRSLTSRAEDITNNLAELTSGIKEFALDPDTKRDIKQAFRDVNSLASNIDSTTRMVSDISFRLHTAVYYADDADDQWRGDFIAEIGLDKYVFRMGFEDVGEGFNVVQVGIRLGRRLRLRTGLFSDEMGLGIDIPFGRDEAFRLRLETFDPDDLVYRAVGSLRVTRGTRLGVWWEERPDDGEITYGGIQQEF